MLGTDAVGLIQIGQRTADSENFVMGARADRKTGKGRLQEGLFLGGQAAVALNFLRGHPGIAGCGAVRKTVSLALQSRLNFLPGFGRG